MIPSSPSSFPYFPSLPSLHLTLVDPARHFMGRYIRGARPQRPHSQKKLYLPEVLDSYSGREDGSFAHLQQPRIEAQLRYLMCQEPQGGVGRPLTPLPTSALFPQQPNAVKIFIRSSNPPSWASPDLIKPGNSPPPAKAPHSEIQPLRRNCPEQERERERERKQRWFFSPFPPPSPSSTPQLCPPVHLTVSCLGTAALLAYP